MRMNSVVIYIYIYIYDVCKVISDNIIILLYDDELYVGQPASQLVSAWRDTERRIATAHDISVTHSLTHSHTH
jgi:hypothetical protein